VVDIIGCRIKMRGKVDEGSGRNGGEAMLAAGKVVEVMVAGRVVEKMVRDW
jgi:hypothetical protein